MISLTPAATQEFQRILTLRSADKLRLSLGNSDCEQYFYRFEAIGAVANADGPAEDLVMEVAGVTISIDRQYQHYLQDLQIDFAQDLMGGGFLFQNPAAGKVCRCGSAFTARVSNTDAPGAFEI
jgi:iron-sulfur cluster assembly protein